MAKNMQDSELSGEERAMRELEKELDAVRKNLKELESGTVGKSVTRSYESSAAKSGAVSKKSAPKKKTKANAAAQVTSESDFDFEAFRAEYPELAKQELLARKETIEALLNQFQENRKQNLKAYQEIIESAEQERKQFFKDLLKNGMEQKKERLEWLKALKQDNRQYLEGFLENLASEGQQDSQDRQAMLEQIRSDLQRLWSK